MSHRSQLIGGVGLSTCKLMPSQPTAWRTAADTRSDKNDEPLLLACLHAAARVIQVEVCLASVATHGVVCAVRTSAFTDGKMWHSPVTGCGQGMVQKPCKLLRPSECMRIGLLLEWVGDILHQSACVHEVLANAFTAASQLTARLGGLLKKLCTVAIARKWSAGILTKAASSESAGH